MDKKLDVQKVEESKNTSGSMFTPKEPPGIKNKLDMLSDSKEDEEAIPADNYTKSDNVYQDLRNSKNNGYMREDGTYSDDDKLDEEEIGKLNLEEELKADQRNSDRRPSAQHGESGMPYDAGSVYKPTSPSNLDNLGNEEDRHDSKNNTEKSLNSKRSSKDEVGWNDDIKLKGNNEDEKHDEERSLLDPENDGNPYVKDISRNDDDDKDMRRSSTKPERPKESRDKSRNSDSNKKDEEVKPKEMSACQKKSIAFLDSWQWGIFMTIVTIYTLFFDDIRVCLIPKDADDAFYTITVL